LTETKTTRKRLERNGVKKKTEGTVVKNFYSK